MKGTAHLPNPGLNQFLNQVRAGGASSCCLQGAPLQGAECKLIYSKSRLPGPDGTNRWCSRPDRSGRTPWKRTLRRKARLFPNNLNNWWRPKTAMFFFLWERHKQVRSWLKEVWEANYFCREIAADKHYSRLTSFHRRKVIDGVTLASLVRPGRCFWC